MSLNTTESGHRGQYQPAFGEPPAIIAAAGTATNNSEQEAPMEQAEKIIIVDDDAGVRELLTDYLGDNGFEVTAVANGEALREALERVIPRVVLLDISLPGEDGLSLARYVREKFDIGIIMVSGAGETVDRIVGLEIGADDYVSKPFDLRELHARLKSVIRRYPGIGQVKQQGAEASRNRVAFGVNTLDLDSCQLFDANGSEVSLTASEFDLLKVFVERPNRPLSRDQLMSLTRNREWDPFDRSIDIRIARLRKKVEIDPDKPQTIRTKRGLGYMYVPEQRQD